MDVENNISNSTRRNFLKVGIGVGAGLLTGLNSRELLASNPEKGKEGGKKVKLLTADGKLVEVEETSIHYDSLKPAVGKEAHIGLPNKKFTMVIDLARCKNARKCVDACQEGHHLPKDHEWIKLYLLQDSEIAAPYWFPRPCFHCDNPLCVSVCPVGATFKRTDGIVLVDNERCIGCKFCMTGCPYSVRVFNWTKPYVNEETLAAEGPYSPETNYPPVEGTVGKCVFCADNLRKNKLPRCVTACPMGVIYFGNVLEDTVTNGSETVRLSTLLKDKSGYRYLEELGTQPSVYYLPPVNRKFPVERGFKGIDQEVVDRYKNTPYVKNLEHNE